MGIVKNILKKLFKENTIVLKQRISESAYWIKIKGENIKNAEFIPGYFLRVGVGFNDDELSLHGSVRSYSVWDIDKTKGTIDIAIATHSKGVGAKWIEECKVGDNVRYNWKKGNFILDDSADSYLFIGDLSALSHLYILQRNLPKNKQIESIVYSKHRDELYEDIDDTRPFEFYETQENPVNEIIEKVKEIVTKMNGKKMVYIGGDSRVCVALNKYFRNELNWETKQIKTKPFWNPDKKGLE